MNVYDRMEEGPRASVWIFGALLGIAAAAFILFVSLSQVASPGAGERIMARTIASTTEIDSSIAGIQESLLEAATQSGQDPLPVPDFPIGVEVPRDVVVSGDSARLRDAILDRASQRMYDDGMGVWDNADPEASQNIATSSTAGAIRAAFTFIGPIPFLIYVALAVFSLITLAGLVLVVFLHASAPQRLTVIGGALLVAGAVSTLAALVLSLSASSIGGDGPYSDDLSAIMSDVVSAGLRNALIVTFFGGVLLAIGAGMRLFEQRQEVPLRRRI